MLELPYTLLTFPLLDEGVFAISVELAYSLLYFLGSEVLIIGTSLPLSVNPPQDIGKSPFPLSSKLEIVSSLENNFSKSGLISGLNEKHSLLNEFAR